MINRDDFSETVVIDLEYWKTGTVVIIE